MYCSLRQKRAYERTDFPKELEKIVLKMDNEMKQRQEQPKDQPESKEGEEESDKTDRNKPILPQLQIKFKNAQSYGYDKIKFSMWHSMYEVIESIIFLLVGLLPYLWDLATRIGKEKLGVEGEIGVSLIFMGIMTIIGTITSLPWELVSCLILEEKMRIQNKA